jgi:hypothetical protein
VPIPTLRKWALREDVPSFLEKTPIGQIRMVSLHGVYLRAEELGRSTRGATPAAVKPPVVDLTADGGTAQPALPEGTMLVPLDAWNKMLNQLGNLHEAGQQLAEARERAAKAETQATFLRERLAELREELAAERLRSEPPGVEQPAVESAPSQPSPEPQVRSAGLTAYPAAMLTQLRATWKVRRRR